MTYMEDRPNTVNVNILHNARGIPSVLRHKHIHTQTQMHTQSCTHTYTDAHAQTETYLYTQAHTRTGTHKPPVSYSACMNRITLWNRMDERCFFLFVTIRSRDSLRNNRNC